MTARREGVLGQVPYWDTVTAGTVLGRIEPTTGFSFFTEAEAGCARALCSLLLGDTGEVAVARMVDARLARGDTDGWHHEAIPEEGQAWKQSLAALDLVARAQHDQPFALLGRGEQTEIIQEVRSRADAGDVWHGLPAGQLWGIWMRFLCAAFYSHPYAWDEIGFPGPAYPRGYKNLGLDRREPYERSPGSGAP